MLSREIGLCAASIGSTAIELAVKTRMREIGCSTVHEYVERVQRSARELRCLIEHVVVSETWFFRDADVFRTLLEYVNGPLRRARASRSLRVLTIPCATGEEAYSIAITLLDGGLTPAQFSIQAFDLSENALTAARRGVYGKNSFRGGELGSRRSYFETRGDELEVGELARASVKLAHGNLLDSGLLPSHSQYDVIFCRNVLIYLDRSARARAFDNLCSWLASDGILFAGHAESLDNMDRRFQPLSATAAFAYVRRAAVQPAAVEPRRGAARPKEQLLGHQTPPGRARSKPNPALARLEAAAKASPDAGALAQVAALADRGELAAAALSCERLIASSAASAEAYHLLGVVRHASGDSEAALECFSKALYVDPQHHESLVYSALIHEQRGQRPEASNFRRRAERLRKKAAT
jgi:chemotaxis protein methyltransferase WspC